MKDFFKNVLATMLGIFLFGCVMSIIGFLCLIGLIATSSTTTKIDKNSVLVLKLDGNMTEQNEENMMNSLQGVSTLSFEGTMNAIKKPRKTTRLQAFISKQGNSAQT